MSFDPRRSDQFPRIIIKQYCGFFIAPEDIIHSPGQSGCPTPGCKGIGHIKGAKYIGHHR